MLASLTATAAASLAGPVTDTAAQVAVRLCKRAPQILFHSPKMEENEAKQSHAMQTATVIRERLRRARDGQWLELINDLSRECMNHMEELQQAEEAKAKAAGVGAGSPEVFRERDSDELMQQAAQAATIRARTGSYRSAVSILTSGPPVPPGPETDKLVRDLFRSSEPTADEHADFQRALAEAAATPRRKRLRVTMRMVGKQAAAIRPAAGTGGSGWRNSYIQLTYADPAGPAALQAWSQVWAYGDVSP